MKKSVSKVIPTIKFDPTQQTASVEIDTNTIVEENQTSNSTDSTSSTENRSLNKVYYIADHDGAIASYNPNYIVRQESGKQPYKIFLPASEGTLALTKDLNGVKTEINEINETLDVVSKDVGVLQTDVERISKKVDGYISIQDLQQALGEAVASDIPENEYTLEDIRTSYNKLLQSLRNLIKEN